MKGARHSLVRLVAFVSLTVVASSVAALDWPGRVNGIASDLRDGDTEVRTAAAEELGLVASVDATELLAIALADHEPLVRAAAAMSAGQIGSVDSIDRLVELLSDRSREVRIASALALGDLRAHEAQEPIARLLGDAHAEVREAAVRALAALGSREAVLAIVGVLHDRSRPVVVAALEALGQLGQPSSLYAILEKVHDPMEEIAVASIDALVALRAPEAIPALIELAQTGRAGVALAAMDALGTLEAREATEMLVAEVMSPSVDGGADAAAMALTAINSPAALPALLPMLSDQTERVGPIFEAAGVGAWSILRDTFYRVGADGPEAETILGVWLRCGDPAALEAASTLAMQRDGVEARREMAVSYFMQSPTAAGLCRAVELTGPPADSYALLEYVERASEVEAGECIMPLVEHIDLLSEAAVLEVASTLADAGHADAATVAARHIDFSLLDWSDAARLAVAFHSLGESGTDTMLRLLASEDIRIRREAAYALADTEHAWLDRERFDAMRTASARQAEVLKALRSQLAFELGDEIRAWLSSLSQSGTIDERLEAFALLRDGCGVPDAAVTDAMGSTDYWLRRSGYHYADACAPELLAAASDLASDSDPTVRALGIRRGADVDLAQIAADATRSVDERVAALGRIADEDPDVAGSLFGDLTRDSQPAVVAAAWIAYARVETVVDARDLALTAAASRQPLERAVLYSLVGGLDDSLLEHARRREEDAVARRVLDGDDLDDELFVFAVDSSTGAPRQDERVIVLTSSGTLELLRTDHEGRAEFRGDVVVAYAVAP